MTTHALPLPRLPIPRFRQPLPGFGLSLGLGLAWLSVVVLLPLAALAIRAAGLGLDGWLRAIQDPRVQASLKLSFGAALVAALAASLAGTLVAWVVVRYRFPGRRLLDALVDLPFALPTAVAGIALTAIYSANGWVGRWLEPLGLKIAYTPDRHRHRAGLHRPAVRSAHACSRCWKRSDASRKRPRLRSAPRA